MLTLTFTTLAISNPGVILYFQQSNFAGKLIVLGLGAFSLIAWTLMIGKYLELKRLNAMNRVVEDSLAKHSVLGFESHNESLRGPFKDLLKGVSNAFYASTSKRRMGHVENALSREVAKQSANYEGKMVMLGSIVSGAPFVGLLGTVWGVMDAFGSIALSGTGSLQHLAPGVSGALLTTVAALLVAIPSVFGYNFLLTRVKQMIIELENFASSIADRLELELED